MAEIVIIEFSQMEITIHIAKGEFIIFYSSIKFIETSVEISEIVKGTEMI